MERVSRFLVLGYSDSIQLLGLLDLLDIRWATAG